MIPKGGMQSILDRISNVSDVSGAMVAKIARDVNKEVVGPMVRDFMVDNFMAGGRPRFAKNSPLTTWAKRIKGSAGVGRPLVDTGKLFDKAILNPVIVATERSVILKIRAPSARIIQSAAILHDGGVITSQRTPAMRRFFWAMFYKARNTGDTGMADAWKKSALTKKTTLRITIPPRRWTKLQAQQVMEAKKAFRSEMNRRLQLLKK